MQGEYMSFKMKLEIHPKKIILAYSGGLDTSVILAWLKEKYSCEIIAFCADIGQKEELSGLEEKGKKTGEGIKKTLASSKTLTRVRC